MSKMNMRSAGNRPSWLLLLLGIVVCVLTAIAASEPVRAHGERNQEPFLRMRTVNFYDVKFSVPDNAKLTVNDELTMTGKFRLFNYWPASVAAPGLIYMNAATAGAAFVKKESWVNETSAIQSFKGELGGDYEFKVVLQARTPGPWHVHPMVNVQDAGGLLGPGLQVEVSGDQNDFVYPVTTLGGTEIASLDSYGIGNVYRWHIVWAVIAVAWLLWWIRRPVLMPRFLMSRTGEDEDELVTETDFWVAAGFAVLTIGLVTAGYFYTVAKYPTTIPLQTGTAFVDPLPEAPSIPIKVKKAKFYVPGRTVLADVQITNDSDSPIQIGEFASVNLRFVNLEVPAAAATIEKGYPREYLPPEGLKVSDNTPIAPGETRTVKIEATDASWELERLTSLLSDPDSTLGGLLFFYDSTGKRYVSEMFSPMIPVFRQEPADQSAEMGGAPAKL